MPIYFDQTAGERKSEATTTIQVPEVNPVTTECNSHTSNDIDSKNLQATSKSEQNNVRERNAIDKNKKNTTPMPVSGSGNKSGNNRRSFSTVVAFNKRLTSFHAQKELYRSNKVTPDSDTDDSISSSSDDD